MSSTLRKSMQSILDEMQNGTSNELDKVSLERLATIDANLFTKIKQAALADKPQSQLFSTSTTQHDEEDWSSVSVNVEEISGSLQSLLNTLHDNLYEKEDALRMTEILAAAKVARDWLESASASSTAPVASSDNKEDTREKAATGVPASAGLLVKPEEFTNEGVKKMRFAVVALLYEGGLPYVSSADGRRFRTEIELSRHLDALFKKKQIEKGMSEALERGWNAEQAVWCLDAKPQHSLGVNSLAALTEQSIASQGTEELDTTFPADDTRDHCVICGKVFKMIQKNDELVYDNCREITVLNDDAAATESENQLVHFSCWRGLGEPVELTIDQTMQI